MKVTVLGCGALGQLWLTALYKNGHEAQGWLRVPQPFCSVNLIETDGSNFNESMTANDPDFLATSDLLLVTLKAWQVSQAVRNLAAILPATAPILLIHNGMGTLDELKALNTHCCWRPPLMPPAAMATSSFTSRREQLILDQPKAIAKITAASPTFCKTFCRMSPGTTISTLPFGVS